MSRILLATMPFDGHFNPLTSLAVHLQQQGHEVRWYTGPGYAERLAALGIPHYTFVRARDVNAQNLGQVFPEYERLGVGPRAIEFALRELFFGNIEAHYRDICELRDGGFPFDALICDAAFYAARLVAEKLNPRVYVIGVAPTPAPTSKTAPPPFFGLKPARSILGRVRDRLVSAMIERTTARCMPIFNDLRAREKLPPYRRSIFDIHVETARAIFQIGTPGLDYPRTDWPANLRFIGALLPYRSRRSDGSLGSDIENKLAQYRTLILVSQGTVDNRDPGKLLVPSLEALKDTPQLVVAATGRRNSRALAQRFPQDNVIVTDWIDFDVVLPRTDVFICNGGFGSVLLSLSNGVPLLAAGKLECKNDVNARLAYRGVAIDLRTERPKPRMIARGVYRLLTAPEYRQNARRAQAELAAYHPLAIIGTMMRDDGLS